MLTNFGIKYKKIAKDYYIINCYELSLVDNNITYDFVVRPGFPESIIQYHESGDIYNIKEEIFINAIRAYFICEIPQTDKHNKESLWSKIKPYCNMRDIRRIFNNGMEIIMGFYSSILALIPVILVIGFSIESIMKSRRR